MSDLNHLAIRMLDLKRRVSVVGSEKAVRVARAIVDDVIDHTPVDEGHTVSSWAVGLGRASIADRTAFVEGRLGSTADVNRSAARSAAHAILAAPKPAGVPIYISNASEAIGYLNDGSSKQEPAGFVERGVAVGRLAARTK